MGGSGLKYFVDCKATPDDETCGFLVLNIKNKQIIKYKEEPETAIILSVLNHYNTKKYKRKTQRKQTKKNTSKKNTQTIQIPNKIVVKTWLYGLGYPEIYKEFQISQKLQNIHGFIKFIAFLDCYDKSYTKKTRQEFIDETKTLTKSERNKIQKIRINENICNGDERKQLLVMPYYENSSIENYEWNSGNTQIIKSLLLQTIFSCFSAFVKFGFVHRDLHLDNILIDTCNESNILYNIEDSKTKSIPTMGYKIVIMDFERSSIEDTDNHTKTSYYSSVLKHKLLWDDYYMMIRGIDFLETITCYDNTIYNFVKNRSSLFDKNIHNVIALKLQDDDGYGKAIQNMLKTQTITEEQYVNMRKLLFDEIEKLSFIIENMNFVDK